MTPDNSLDQIPEPKDTAGVIAPPPIVVAIAFGAAFLLQKIHSLAIPWHVAAIQWPGLLLMDLSAALALWATLCMKLARTHINPLLPTTALVTTGPYRFSRNPLSISLFLLYFGLTLHIDSLWPLLLLIPLLIVFHVGVIQREERYLERKFGNIYRAYRAAVPRWL